MVELFGKHKEMESRKSSKGNQLKWEEQGIWYKADYTGYEGLAEYVISGLFAYSSLGGKEYVSYQTEEIVYGHNRYCPIFDHGAALLADTTMDYPLTGDTIGLMKEVRAKTICQDFDEQLDAVERLYGQHIQFSYNRKVVESVLAAEKYYPAESKRRVGSILMDQKRKYRYLFADGSSE